jgi:hypothetical protein
MQLATTYLRSGALGLLCGEIVFNGVHYIFNIFLNSSSVGVGLTL